MLSEEKIRKMIRLSDYETGLGSADLKKNHYKKMDYIRLQMLKTSVAVVTATILIFVLVCLCNLDYILIHLFEIPFGEVVMYAGAGLIVLEITFLLLTVRIAKRQYEESFLRVEEYNKTLHELLDLYVEEEGQEENAL